MTMAEIREEKRACRGRNVGKKPTVGHQAAYSIVVNRKKEMRASVRRCLARAIH